MDDNFQALNLNARLQSNDSPLTRLSYTTGYDFSTQYEVQTNRLHSSKLVVDDLIYRTGLALATADFSTNADQTILVTTKFSDPNRFKPFFGTPYVSIWEGTVRSNDTEIWPIKGTAVAGTYTVNGGFSYQAWQGSNSMVYRTQIVRNAGTSSQQFVFGFDSPYIDYVKGKSE